MNKIKTIALWLWQLPQNILAVLIFNLLGHWSYYAGKYKGDYMIVNKVILSSFALGDYMFLTPKGSNRVIDHEHGHCIQSTYLGPLYLLVIAIPSVLHNIWYKICNRSWDYFSFYTEAWAEKLSKKDR